MEILLAHLFGDYVIQSDWMANEKTKRSWPAIVHAITYTLPFLIFVHSWLALLFVCSTHFVIDRWRLAKYVVFVKNYLAPRGWWYNWEDCQPTGYHHDRPAFMSVWLMIIADNAIHLLLNYVAVRYL